MDNIQIRLLTTLDKEAFKEHMNRLDSISKNYRFFGGMSKYAIEDYVNKSFNHKCFGNCDIKCEKECCVPTGIYYGAFDGDYLCGVGQLQPISKSCAELAFSIDDNYRKKGLGILLFQAIKDIAIAFHYTTLNLIILPENAAMRNLAIKFGVKFEFSDGELYGRLKL